MFLFFKNILYGESDDEHNIRIDENIDDDKKPAAVDAVPTTPINKEPTQNPVRQHSALLLQSFHAFSH